MTPRQLRTSRSCLASALLLSGWLAAAAALAQAPAAAPNPLAAPAAASGSGQNEASAQRDLSSVTASSDDPVDEGTPLMVAAPGSSRTETPARALSLDQLTQIFSEQPDALIEVKTLVAEVAQQQGQSISPDAVTDQMFYERLSASPELRENITTLLRARGYLQDGESDDGPSESAAVADPLAKSDATRENRVIREQLSGSAPRRPSAPSETGRGRDRETLKPQESGAEVLHRDPPYNLRSLRDTYTQIPQPGGPLRRFGSEMFLDRSSDTSSNGLATPMREPALDVSPGPDYILGPGDSLVIQMWGGVTQSLTRAVDRSGHVVLPEAGVVDVAGQSLRAAGESITAALRRQYRSLQVAVTVSHLRSIRVYVVGDVQRPGAYEISSLATPLSALFAAGGPTRVGSMRVMRHYRGRRLVGEIDLYDFLLHGVASEDRLQAGDTLLIPPAGTQVSVYGAVKRPATYEVREHATLAELLDDAGGATVAADLSQITIDRIDADQKRITLTLPPPASSAAGASRAAMESFDVRDGDTIRVAQIAAYSERVVYADGHFVHPGRIAYRDGMRLGELLHSYRDLLPEPAERGEIVRLAAPDLHPETIDFSVPEVLIGNQNPALAPFDTIRIYGRYELDAPRVTVAGEVLNPGVYALPRAMTAAELVRMAGGFKRDALVESADLSSYSIMSGRKVVSNRTTVRIGDAVSGADPRADVVLKAGDVLTIHQISGWSDIGSAITVEGEVAHPGSYGIQQGERLSSVLTRAGGLRETAYAEGAVLLRDEVRRLEEKSREELIRQIESSSIAARMHADLGSSDQTSTLQLVAQQQQEVLARLKSQPATGRLVIHISRDISAWANTTADIEVRAGDVLRIPKRPGFVLVSGQVYNASAITYVPGKSAGWYLRRAGGATEVANTREIFIIRANGSVVGRSSNGFLSRDVLGTRLDPGDVVVVPQKILGASLFWRNLLTVAQITSSIAITAAVAGVI